VVATDSPPLVRNKRNATHAQRRHQQSSEHSRRTHNASGFQKGDTATHTHEEIQRAQGVKMDANRNKDQREGRAIKLCRICNRPMAS